jgi:hypothetical protein
VSESVDKVVVIKIPTSDGWCVPVTDGVTPMIDLGGGAFRGSIPVQSFGELLVVLRNMSMHGWVFRGSMPNPWPLPNGDHAHLMIFEHGGKSAE